MALKDSWIAKKFSPQDERDAQMQSDLLEEMGIDRNESARLRNSMLSPTEAVAAKGEELTRIRQHKGRKQNWDEFLDIKRRMGRVMHHSEFFRKLRRLIPSLILTDGRTKDKFGNQAISMYMMKYHKGDILNGILPGNRLTYLGWIYSGTIPEYTIDIVNDAGVPVWKRQGWRGVLVGLICRRDKDKYPTSIVTEREAFEEFGNPTNGPTANIYLNQLYGFRNGII